MYCRRHTTVVTPQSSHFSRHTAVGILQPAYTVGILQSVYYSRYTTVGIQSKKETSNVRTESVYVSTSSQFGMYAEWCAKLFDIYTTVCLRPYCAGGGGQWSSSMQRARRISMSLRCTLDTPRPTPTPAARSASYRRSCHRSFFYDVCSF